MVNYFYSFVKYYLLFIYTFHLKLIQCLFSNYLAHRYKIFNQTSKKKTNKQRKNNIFFIKICLIIIFKYI